jgi:hypothetical protein
MSHYEPRQVGFGKWNVLDTIAHEYMLPVGGTWSAAQTIAGRLNNTHAEPQPAAPPCDCCERTERTARAFDYFLAGMAEILPPELNTDSADALRTRLAKTSAILRGGL